MSNTLAQANEHLPSSERRLHFRQPVRSLAYVELDEGNGGIVLNISEGGLSVQAVTSLMDDVLPGVRFQLSESEGWVEASARITWTGQSRKLAGLEFIDLPDKDRSRIRKWLVRESLPSGAVVDADTSSDGEAPTAMESGPGDATTLPTHAAEPAFVAENRVEQPREEPMEEQRQNAAAGVEEGFASPVVPAEVFAAILDRGHEPAAEPSAETHIATPHITVSLVAHRWTLGGLVMVLAIVSLAAGWAAGQGKLGKFLGRIHEFTPQHGATDGEAGAGSALPITRVSEIEILNASNQRWTIPFNGPLNAPVDGARRQTFGSNSSQSRKPAMGFRTWILAPPLQTRAVADGGEATKENPPVPVDTSNSPANVLSAIGSMNSQPWTEPPSLRKPEPVPSGIVKQGQLIRRVDPVYPALARDQRLEGTVRLNVTVDKDGVVRDVALLGGPRLLAGSAEDAVRKWRYAPTYLDGKPVEFQKEVDLRFHISESPR